jgi:adenine-specific DNA-methyltransferase
MSNNKQKLELTWIGKNNPEYDIANIEPRILEENPELSNTVNDPNTENMIIHGDNLLALKALLPEYEGKVKCIYIDPPYNTGEAFEHYDDSVEHSTWLSLMKPRLELLRTLLDKNNGTIWISIDANESHYLKVLCDEVFGRSNFIDEVIWQRSYAPINLKKTLSRNHDTILVYGKSDKPLILNKLPRSDELNASFTNPDNDPRGPWASGPIQVGPRVESRVYEIITPNGKKVLPPPQACWRFSEEKYKEMVEDNRIYFGANGDNVPRIKRFLTEVKDGVVSMTLWLRDDVGDNQEAKKEIKQLFDQDIFDTPKPERLIQRILTLGSEEGDIVLDSFLGSGTTIAVAQKMGRKYIGIEMGDHAYTHVEARMKKVINGNDGLNLSEVLGWKGGGAYKFYELAPSFIVKDEFGNSVIDDFYNDSKLIKVMCKLMNFTYKPSQTEYWKHGTGQGKNYLYVTTQLLTSGMVQQIAQYLTAGESLIICPKKFEPGADKIDNRITIKKIPQSVLKACHFGKKEYLLPIKETAMEEVEAEEELEDNE